MARCDKILWSLLKFCSILKELRFGLCVLVSCIICLHSASSLQSSLFSLQSAAYLLGSGTKWPLLKTRYDEFDNDNMWWRGGGLYCSWPKQVYSLEFLFVNLYYANFSTNDSLTLGRLLFKISRKKKKPKSRARIRYRLSTRFDLRNLNYATENEPEENLSLEEIEEINEEEESTSFVREVLQPHIREFDEISVESLNMRESTGSEEQELSRKVIDFWLNRGWEVYINSIFQALLEFFRKLLKCWLLGLLLLLFLVYLCSITFHEDHCTSRNLSCTLDGYVELSRMG